MNHKIQSENSPYYQKKDGTTNFKDIGMSTQNELLSSLLKTLVFIFFLLLILFSIYLISINYCKTHKVYKALEPYMANQYAMQILKFVDEKVCPLTKYKHPLLDNLVKTISIYF